MNIDRNDSWSDDNDFLSGALRGAADNIPGGEVDDLHISFGVVRDRVRRRRAAKIGSLAGVSLVLVGGIAFGATKTPLLESDGPVLPGSSHSAFLSPGPDDSASDTATQAPEPSPGGPPARDNIEFDYTPPWLSEINDGRLTCGMPVDELESTAAGWSVAAAGDIYAVNEGIEEPTASRGMAATVEQGEGTLDVAPVLVWSQNGVVVDFGPNVFDGSGPREPLLSAAEGAVEAQGSVMQTCLPTGSDTNPTFEFPSPPGDYQVRVVAFPQVAPGQWATAVSEPVEVRIDLDVAHSPAGTRGGPATIDPPEITADVQSWFVLDRTTDWVTAELTHQLHNTSDEMSVMARCESANPADTVGFEVAQPSTGAVLGSGSITCDGEQIATLLGVLDGGTEFLDIRLTEVPDGVARLWAVLAPDSGDGDDTTAECSASGLTTDYDASRSPSEGAGATAQAIVEAALDCDSDRLVELATQYPTELMVTAEPAEEVFALPEGDEQHYRTLVALLAGTGGAFNGGDAGNQTVVWPRVVAEEFRDSHDAWQEVVEAGLLTQEQADAQRAEPFGYTGMRIAIDESGAWRYYSPTP